MGSDTSPVIRKEKKRELMTFPKAVKKIIEGKRVARIEWVGKSYFYLRGSLLVHLDGKDHRLDLRDVDMLANDWLVVS